MNIDIKRRYKTKSGKLNFYIFLKEKAKHEKIGVLSLPSTGDLKTVSTKLNSFKTYRFNKATKKLPYETKKSLWSNLLRKLDLQSVPEYLTVWRTINRGKSRTYNKRWVYANRPKINRSRKKPGVKTTPFKFPNPWEKWRNPEFWNLFLKTFSKPPKTN